VMYQAILCYKPKEEDKNHLWQTLLIIVLCEIQNIIHTFEIFLLP
jgi:hypothetical protein